MKKIRKQSIIKLIFVLLGGALGGAYFPLIFNLLGIHSIFILNNIVTSIILGAIIFYGVSLLLANRVEQLINRIEHSLSQKSLGYLLMSSLSMIIGLVLAILISIVFFRSNSFFMNTIVPAVLMLVFGYLGFRLGTNRIDEWKNIIQFRSRNKNNNKNKGKVSNEIAKEANYHHYKILDTNILIDGRIYDLVKTGFLEGTLLVPNFVLYELQYIADASDSVKRVRGRRGLDILNKLQKERIIPIEMVQKDYNDISEVDSKLIQLAKDFDGVIVTNDYNLNKVIQFQHVKVLNINALANSLRQKYIPGESLSVLIIKKGTERQQGVAYLNDGTMVVVEEGRRYLNQRLRVTVTSAIQTDAGKMIFAKIADTEKNIAD